MTVHGYFDWLKRYKKRQALFNLVSPCALNRGPCTCRQRKHDEKHTTIPFHGFPDRCF